MLGLLSSLSEFLEGFLRIERAFLRSSVSFCTVYLSQDELWKPVVSTLRLLVFTALTDTALPALRPVSFRSSTIDSEYKCLVLLFGSSCPSDFGLNLWSDYGFRLDFVPFFYLYFYNSSPFETWSRIPRATGCLSDDKGRPSGSSSGLGLPLSAIKAYK